MNEEAAIFRKDFVLTEGVWREGVSWKFVASEEKLDEDLCTAVFCIPIYKRKLILVRQVDRGWEIPGGHIEDGEDVGRALKRELLEESGAIVDNPKKFGHRVISPPAPIKNRATPNKMYPFPVSYVPYYYSNVLDWIPNKLHNDILQASLVTFTEAKSLIDSPNNRLLDYLVIAKLIDVQI